MIEGSDREFVAFDLEATGLSLREDRIIEVGAVRFDGGGRVLATFDRLVNPLRPSGVEARKLHGIDDDLLGRAEPAAAVLPEFVAFLGDPGGTTLVAHNAAFDAGLLGRELARAGLTLPGHLVVDTLAWARRVWPRPASHKLDDLARRAGGAPPSDSPPAHRALGDSDRVRRVFLALRAAEPPGEARIPLAYPIFDGGTTAPVPWGWGLVAGAIDRAEDVEVVYDGGTRGPEPRRLTPTRFEHRGGTAYLVATCHLDGKIKDFQLDRLRSCRALGPVAVADPAAGAPAT